MKRSGSYGSCYRALLAAAVVFFLLIGPGAVLPAHAEDILARVDVPDRLDDIQLPVYAHLMAADGTDYALVIASREGIAATGFGFEQLDSLPPGGSAESYIVALEVLPGSRARAARLFDVLLDDGRQIVLRADDNQARALAEMGFEIDRLDAEPMNLTAPPLPFRRSLFLDPHPDVDAMIQAVDQSRVRQYAGNLSGEWPVRIGGGNYTMTTRNTSSGTPIAKATQYVYEFMQNIGMRVSYHQWNSGRNVVAEKTGGVEPGKIILITAHLDDMPSRGAAPGADDNASGSVGVMLAAEMMKPYTFDKTVRFVFFTGEEQGLLGSAAYAAKVAADHDDIVAVFNMDMIAWDKIGGPVCDLHTRRANNPGEPADRQIAELFVEVVQTYGISGLTPQIVASGETRSDHASFWNRGFPGILSIEDGDDFNEYYHTSNDRLSALNLDYFTSMVKAAVGTAAHLAVPAGDTPPDDEIVELTSGQTIAGINLAAGEWKTYKIRVNQGQVGLVGIWGADGDADLYTRMGQAPTERDFDCKPANETGNEVCELQARSAGEFFVGIRANSAVSGCNLKAVTRSAALNGSNEN